MSLIGDESPSCSLCGKDSCKGFIATKTPISLQPVRDQMVQSSHLDAELAEGEEAEAGAPQIDTVARRGVAKRSAHPSANRALQHAQDRAHHSEGDR